MKPVRRGCGPLFVDPSADAVRAAFREKPRSLRDKVTTVSEAVTRLIHDGDYVAIGGFGGDRIATAVCHEIVRQRKQELRLAGHTATHNFQILCAGNQLGEGRLFRQVDIAYVVGLEARGLSPHARRVMESSEVESTEWSNYALALRYKAAAMGVPFLPVRSLLGTDTFERSAAIEIDCPFTGARLAAVPALSPDVAAIHVHEADRYGNCRIKGPTIADLDLARAAKRLIITCERLIPNDVIRSDPSSTLIPFFCVDAVCEVPFGSYPANMPYEYYSDEKHIAEWLTVEEDVEQYRAFLQRMIHGVGDFSEYLQLCGGLPRLMELRREEFMLHRGK